MRKTVTVQAGNTTTVTFATKGAVKRSLQRGATVSPKVSLSGTNGTTLVQPGTVKVSGTKR